MVLRPAATRSLLASLPILLLAACEAPPPAPSPAPEPPRVSSTAAAAAETNVVWVERVPDGVAPDAALPLVIGIHGLGDSPESFCRVFDDLRAKVRVACPRAFARHGRGWSWFPIDADDATKTAAIGAAADRLAAAIDRLATARRAPGRPVVAGFSQGGALAFAIAVRHPTSIARAVPMGGWLPEPLWPAAGAPVAPITALHGETDARIPIDRSRAAVDALAARGADATLRAFPGVGHTIPPEVRGALYGAIEQALDAGAPPVQDAAP